MRVFVTWIRESEPGSLANDISLEISTGHVAIVFRIGGKHIVDCQNVADEPRKTDSNQNLKWVQGANGEQGSKKQGFTWRASHWFDTYGENLKDVDACEVQLLILGVHRKRHGYVAEVL